MHPRLFRLIEKHQRIDELLRGAQPQAHGMEIVRLRSLKRKVKHLIARSSIAQARRAAPPATYGMTTKRLLTVPRGAAH